ncbi:2OG-Fe dioxygenase family protein [Streptomyces johnsoniae]|uniref:2OG-Fe dioxygenase family protein n=1 Tax=Streptomyces johnsoniae TaxID=3075532 RepID=A0ABU2RZR6_9ACTN|nr:2OG-Fe dioxygenase family protein [Streptomyces sp. DSM 41886]MDT0442254.1 2OG-Fe dioxygenase family protein [Streptomyces sp. DSM 41886]
MSDVIEDAGSGTGAVRRALATTGAHLMPPAAVSAALGAGPADWDRFAAHWEELGRDRYAAEGGTCRLRRYGDFTLTGEGELSAEPHVAFVQPKDTNPLFVDRDRHFEPLTDAFVADPLLRSLLALLSDVAAGLTDTSEWRVKVHPFRVVAAAGSEGRPTPEGRHQDGVTLVSSLLIGRDNATGGRSAVFDEDGGELLTTTLAERGTLLLGDDRRTWHAVSPIRPADATASARRDVLVVTLTATGQAPPAG